MFMGVQCNFIITWYEEDGPYAEVLIYNFLKYGTATSAIAAGGTRNWGPGDLQTEVICMKDWFEDECQRFIAFLKTITWEYPDTVQLYWQPATFENHIPFRYQKLYFSLATDL